MNHAPRLARASHIAVAAKCRLTACKISREGRPHAASVHENAARSTATISGLAPYQMIEAQAGERPPFSQEIKIHPKRPAHGETAGGCRLARRHCIKWDDGGTGAIARREWNGRVYVGARDDTRHWARR